MPVSAPTARPLARSLTSLRAAGEKATGARADWHELLKLLRAIGPGDVVTVTRIGRLAREALSQIIVTYHDWLD